MRSLATVSSVVPLPLVHDAAPGGPARDAEGGGEEIGGGDIGRHLVDIHARDHSYTVVVLVAVKHLLAEGEEGLCREVVVLQHDTLVDDGERPLLRQILRGVTPLVVVAIMAIDLAFPIDLVVGTDGPAGGNTLLVALVALPRAVLVEE